MSDVDLPERTNHGTESACAWPGCPNARASWFRVEPKPGVGELLPVCGRHRVQADGDPTMALRVWRDRLGRPQPKDRTDHVLAGSLLREITRVPGISRQRLVEWVRNQSARRTKNEARPAGTATLDDVGEDVLATLDLLVREGKIKQRKLGMSGSGSARGSIDCAYFSLVEDEEEPWTTTATTTDGASRAPTAAVPTARAARTPFLPTSEASAKDPASATTATPPTPTGSATTEPPSPSVAAEAPDDDCSEPATFKSSDAPEPERALRRPGTTTATPSHSKEPTMSKAKPGARRHAVTTFLREHPNSTMREIAKALGWTNEVTRNAIGNARMLFVSDGHQRWSNATTTATDPPGAHGTPRTTEPRVSARKQADATVANKMLADLTAEARAESRAARDREAALATAIDAALAPWGAFPDGAGLVDRIADIRRRHEADARDLEDLRVQKARFIEEEAALREWRCAVEVALGEPDEEIEASVAVALIAAGRASDVIDELCKITGATRETLVERVRGGPEDVPDGEPMRVMQVGESEQYGPCVTLTCDRTAAKQLGERLYEHVTVTL